jgi:hypothetical protein
LNNPGPERMFMAKKNKKDGVSEQKKAEMRKKWESEDQEIIPITTRESSEGKRCAVPGCPNESMKSSNVCVDHYQKVSNEMSKSVKKNESEPWKMYSPTKPKEIE